MCFSLIPLWLFLLSVFFPVYTVYSAALIEISQNPIQLSLFPNTGSNQFSISLSLTPTHDLRINFLPPTTDTINANKSPFGLPASAIPPTTNNPYYSLLIPANTTANAPTLFTLLPTHAEYRALQPMTFLLPVISEDPQFINSTFAVGPFGAANSFLVTAVNPISVPLSVAQAVVEQSLCIQPCNYECIRYVYGVQPIQLSNDYTIQQPCTLIINSQQIPGDSSTIISTSFTIEYDSESLTDFYSCSSAVSFSSAINCVNEPFINFYSISENEWLQTYYSAALAESGDRVWPAGAIAALIILTLISASLIAALFFTYNKLRKINSSESRGRLINEQAGSLEYGTRSL